MNNPIDRYEIDLEQKCILQYLIENHDRVKNHNNWINQDHIQIWLRLQVRHQNF